MPICMLAKGKGKGVETGGQKYKGGGWSEHQQGTILAKILLEYARCVNFVEALSSGKN